MLDVFARNPDPFIVKFVCNHLPKKIYIYIYLCVMHHNCTMPNAGLLYKKWHEHQSSIWNSLL